MSITRDAERHALKSKIVADMLMVSSQWVALQQYAQEMQQDAQAPKQIGFTGGNNE